MPKRQYALSYELYNNRDLRRFVSGRSLALPVADASRREYICALRRADCEARFRFLDLPPEMRNLVYRELLTLRLPDMVSEHATKHDYCWPLILASCSQARDEATEILYGENTCNINLGYDVTSRFGHGSFTCQFITTINSHWFDRLQASEGSGLLERSILWPEYLWKVRHLRFSVNFKDIITALPGHRHESFNDVLVEYDHTLYDLYSFMRQSNALKNLTLHYSNTGSPLADALLAKLLFPLVLFQSPLSVTGVSTAAEQRLLEEKGLLDESILDPTLLKSYDDLLDRYYVIPGKSEPALHTMVQIEATMNTTLLDTSLIDATKLREFASLFSEFEKVIKEFEGTTEARVIEW